MKQCVMYTSDSDNYLRKILNVTDSTMYEMLRDEDTLDYWKLDDTPQ